MILAESYMELTTDPAHILFELTWEGISTLLAFIIFKKIGSKVLNRFHRDLDVEHGVVHTEAGIVRENSNVRVIQSGK
jgi:hypothetical protein